MLEKAAFGGQITWSPRVENFPGFVSISGNELGDKLLEQAMEQGAEVELEEVTGLEKTDEGWKVLCDSGAAFEGKALILAAGARPRMLGVAREEELVGSGVGYCVNGGGNSALQDALLLSETCSKVYLIHRRDSFRGEQKLVDALRERENVEFVLNASVTALLGGDELTGITVDQNGQSREIPVEGLFVAIGHQPDLEAFAPGRIASPPPRAFLWRATAAKRPCGSSPPPPPTGPWPPWPPVIGWTGESRLSGSEVSSPEGV